MEKWTCFSPEIPAPALYIKVLEDLSKDTYPNGLKPNSEINALPLLSNLPEILSKQGKFNATSKQSKRCQDNAEEITILNSFYIRDIERVIKDIKVSGLNHQSSIGCYLSGNVEKKEDLLTPVGENKIIQMLRLNKMPLGRWPSDNTHAMSLMQQFAINAIEETLTHCGLYSVNGPPGTGKTTMLRDLIANNLVKRAQILATLTNAKDAFRNELNSGGKTIQCLIPSLTGYEMVVVSSNNAAVENISQELPQNKSLGKDWQDIRYLKSVAQKLAAEHDEPTTNDIRETKKDIKSIVHPLNHKFACWGLIATALGKQKNRKKFGERVFYHSITQCLAPAPASDYRTLVPAINELATLSFKDAKSAFLKTQQELEKILAELEKLQTVAEQETTSKQQENKVQKKNSRMLQLNSRLVKIRDKRPSWWSLNIKQRCRYQAITTAFSKRLNTAKAEYQVEYDIWLHLHNKWLEARQSCEEIERKYPSVTFPGPNINLEEPAVQRHAFGQCPEVNHARSLLTVKALELHQAWLVNAHKDVKLYETISSIPRVINGAIANKEEAKAVWQLLFMIVPVVSSTFASVSAQFKNFDKEDIGWLFIDEAGQASPQQAVGAIWRAKKVVVVGDPLQIEPVFTIPQNFIETIAKEELGAKWQEWSPGYQSVQTLADRANPHGTEQIAKGIWLGSPLRVHRRCDDPMFSIANTIAYNNKMLHGRDNISNKDDFVWGESCWFDVAGEREGKHFVPAQAHHVLKMIEAYYERHQKLPDAYIITPFKEIKKELKLFLRNYMKQIRGQEKWLNERIGTVHTFQGKEEKNVILVLGLSGEKPDAAQWASQKPNLLNVAVTRAQKRLYIIGSKKIWAECQYFEKANALLPCQKKQSTTSPTHKLLNLSTNTNDYPSN